MLAIVLYDVVEAIHVMAVVATLGVLFAYPLIVPFLRRVHPEAMPGVHLALLRLARFLLSPGLVVIFAAGAYLASKNHWWDRVWVSVPLLILLVLGGLFGAVMAPGERRLHEIARRDLDAGGVLGGEYDAALRRVALAGYAAAALVLVAVFFMVAKP